MPTKMTGKEPDRMWTYENREVIMKKRGISLLLAGTLLLTTLSACGGSQTGGEQKGTEAKTDGARRRSLRTLPSPERRRRTLRGEIRVLSMLSSRKRRP